MSWPVFPNSTKAGDPAYPTTLEDQKSVPSNNAEAWFAGAIVVRDIVNHEYKLSDGAGIVTKDVGIVAWAKTLTATTGSIFKPPCEVYSQYQGVNPIAVESPIQTEINGLWGEAVSDAAAFGTIVSKAGQGGGGLEDTFSSIVTGEIAKLRITSMGVGTT